MPSALFRDDRAGTELFFAEPTELIAPETVEAFFPALERLEALRAEGKWLAGYFAYESGFLLEPKLGARLPENRRVPLFAFGAFDGPSALPPPVPPSGAIHEAEAAWTFGDYEPRFRRLHRHLAEGDCYQANLTFPIRARWTGEPASLFAALAARQPVRHAALLDFGIGPVVLSRSPELFFAVNREGWIEARPMKGTAPRGSTPEEDETFARFLREDGKTQAENRMIVDLLRNDISLLSEVGTLHVPELFKVETYATLHQMVSTVRAKLRPQLSIREIMAALFPCGSITGAPKIRAMEVLQDLEATPRDVYCGAIGWMAPDGTMRLSVAIRTLSLFEGGEAVFNVGGGIVFDSTAEAEYREALLKARFATGAEPRVRTG
ncbi:MAG: aminodeoxychorismate synthase component I [Mesorhizobium amorphae]|nr:MAG: aminodeoxychorismate synthase component I [Mesorhizobium amorphae]